MRYERITSYPNFLLYQWPFQIKRIHVLYYLYGVKCNLSSILAKSEYIYFILEQKALSQNLQWRKAMRQLEWESHVSYLRNKACTKKHCKYFEGKKKLKTRSNKTAPMTFHIFKFLF